MRLMAGNRTLPYSTCGPTFRVNELPAYPAKTAARSNTLRNGSVSVARYHELWLGLPRC
jgi:hypothetical protein